MLASLILAYKEQKMNNYDKPSLSNHAELKLEEINVAFLDKLLDGNRSSCGQYIVSLKNSGVGFMTVYEKIFKPALYQIGKLWEQNKISVAAEHMATLIVEDLMYLFLHDLVSLERKNKKIIISSVEKEEHQVGGKMVADVFESMGWYTLYLGANTSASELQRFISEQEPDMAALSLSVYMNMNCLRHTLKTIRQTSKVPVLIGGQALNNVGKQLSNEFEKVYYIKDLWRLKEFIENGEYEQ